MTATAATLTTVPAAVTAYRTQRDLIVRECLFLRAEIAHLRHPNPLDTDHDAIKALGAGITELQGRMVKLRKAHAGVARLYGKPAAPKLVVDNAAPAPRTDLTGTMTIVPASRAAEAAALMPAPKAVPTPYEVQQARKAKRTGKAAGEPKPARVKSGSKSALSVAISAADVACTKLLEQEGGATCADIRAATGWKGPIKNGPARCAARVGRALTVTGKGEAARFTLA